MSVLDREVQVLEVLGEDLLVARPFSSGVSSGAGLGDEVNPTVAEDFEAVLIFQVTERIDWVSRGVIIQVVDVVDVASVGGSAISLLVKVDDYTTSGRGWRGSVRLSGHTYNALNIEVGDKDLTTNTLLGSVALRDHE